MVDGRFMRWLRNTDFDNPINWKTGRIPCGNEHVRFPPNIASVIVQRNNTVMEIVSFIRTLFYLLNNIE